MTRRDFAKRLLAVAGAGATGLQAAGAGAAGFQAAGAGAAVATVGAGAKAGRRSLDPLAIGVISDIHTGLPREKQKYRTGRDYPWMPDASKRFVAEILALPHPPATVISLGDISLAFGEPDDYRIAAEVLRPLSDAGIKVVHSMGNHDIRAEFLKAFPGYDKTSEVPGRFVSVVETPHVDFILLDSLKEPDKRGDYAACTGSELGDAQLKWLKERLPALEKPTFVCSHHAAWELKIDKLCAKAPKVVGYLHGHNHRWMVNYIWDGYSDSARELRMLGFPSFGLDHDVGWGLIRTSPAKAVVECKARDHYFPMKRPSAERPPQWDMFVRDWSGREISFAL